MLFSSFTFLFWFLPAVLLLYFGLPFLAGRFFAPARRAERVLALQNFLLIPIGLFFYGWGEPRFLLLPVLLSAASYCAGLLLSRSKHRRLALATAPALLLAPLLFFKYAPLLVPTLTLSDHLPAGISFYTFTAVAYVIDVGSGRIQCEKSPLLFGAYMLFFPRLISGPITRYSQIADALHGRHHTVTAAARGARRFAAGLAKKMLLAEPAGLLFAAAVATSAPTAATAWLGLFGLALQIYFDFSGYTDMAIGLGEIFALPLPENFRYPYIAASVADFWRRWHITLSAFFKDYVYIPLGGNRRGVFRTVCHLFAVWLLTGLWHGAEPNFVLWGLYFFLLLVGEKFLFPALFGRFSRAVCRFFTPVAILFGWLLFAFDGSAPALSLAAIPAFLAALLGKNGAAAGADLYDLLRHLPFLIIACIGATPLPHAIYEKALSRHHALSVLLPLAAMLLSFAYMAEVSFSPFLYFRF